MAQRVFGSMAAAATALGVPLRVLKQLKRQGVPGFHCSGRVHVDQLLPHLRGHEDETAVAEDQQFALECRKLLAQCERIEFDNQVRRGQYRDAAVYHQQHLRFGSRVNLLFKLKRNLAPVELRPLWDKLHGEVMEEMRAAYEIEFADKEECHQQAVRSEASRKAKTSSGRRPVGEPVPQG